MTTDPHTALMVGLTLIPSLIVLDFTVGYLTGTGLRARLTTGLKNMTETPKGELEVRKPKEEGDDDSAM